MKHNNSCLQAVVAVAARESVSQAATPAIRAICAALSAPMFSLAPLKVADITGGLDDISRGFYYGKTWSRPKMANISGWMIYPVDDITEFYCTKRKWAEATDFGLETRVERREEGMLGRQGQDALLRHGALDVVVLQDHVLLEHLDGVDLVRVLQLGQHHLDDGQRKEKQTTNGS